MSSISTGAGSFRFVLKALLIASTAIPASVAAQDAEAGETEQAQPGPGDSDIVVVGSRASRMQALELKRDAPTIIDAVSSDNIGKLPDYNPAEAIQRLPGVSTQLDQGEPRYAVIRGVDPNLNDVTIDGNLVGAPEAEGRRVSLDTLPSDLISAIEVAKAVTPDMDANAVGGNINLVTPSAFDRRDGYLFASARGTYNGKSDKFGYGGSLTYGSTFGANDEFGIVAAASYNKRRFDSDLFEALGWDEVAPGVNAPNQVRLFDYEITRERIGGILNLEYRPTDALRFYVRNIYTEYTDVEGRDQSDYEFDSPTVISPTQISYAEGGVSREFRQNEQTQKIYNISPGGEAQFGDATLRFNFTHGRAEEITPVRVDVEFPSDDDIPSTLDLSGPRVAFSALDPLYGDPANYRFRRLFFRTEEIVEKLNALRMDLRYDLPGGSKSFVKVGGKFISRKKLRDNARERYDVTQRDPLDHPGLGLPPPPGFFRGLYDFGPTIDYRGVIDLFNSNPSGFDLNEEVTLENAFNLDYRIDEKIYAGYAMASVELGALTILGGARIEHTDARYRAFAVLDADEDGTLEPSDISELSGRNTYTDVLPGLHLTYAPERNWQVRAAWTNTIGRPNYDQSVPTFAAEDGEGEAGNPGLAPFRAMALDLSVEFYPDSESILSAAVFYKRIKNPIFNRTTFDVTFNGLDLDALTRPENADKGWLLGIEANLQYRFTFLPSPFDGFGASLNGTYVKSEVDVFGRESENIPFFRQSKWIANAAVFYEAGPFEARIAAAYRSPYLESIGGTAAEDIYFDRRIQWDAKAGYRITENFEIFGSVSNFTDSSRREYQALRRQRFAEEIYGRTFNFGISANF